MAVPYTFGSATSSIPLSQLDSNFATGITLGNTTVYLGNTTTSFGNVTLTNVTISSVSTAITPAQGGTGLVTIPANNVILGNGTANVTVVAPGTTGNVLTSTGTTWASTALSAASVPAAGSTTQVQYNNAGAFAGSANLTFNGTTLTAAGLSGPHNGTVGAATPSTGAFTTLAASSTVSGTGFSTYLASPPAIGGTAAAAGTFTTLTTSSTITDNGGTANGVTYLNGSKVVTSGSALSYDGSVFRNLQSNGTNAWFRATSGTVDTYFGAATSGLGTVGVVGTFSANDLTFYQNSAEGMRLTSTGLGLGTTTMTRTFNIGGSIAGVGLNINNTGTSGRSYSIFSTNSGASVTGVLGFYDDTANAYRMVIDASGNLGIGTSSPSGKLHVSTTGSVISTLESSAAVGGYLTLSNSSTVPLYVGFGPTLVTGISTSDAALRYSNNLIFSSGATEVARFIAGGQLCIGKTSTAFGTTGIYFNSIGQGLYTYTNNTDAGGAVIYLNRLGVDGTIQLFYKDTSAVGSISVTTTLTSYNVTSDYRLKNTIAPMTGALDKVALLKPCTYKWNVNGSDGEGFIAHELAEVVPHAVTGAKDAVDADGKPQYQGIDVSFLVATLTAAIQELDAKFEAYKASHP